MRTAIGRLIGFVLSVAWRSALDRRFGKRLAAIRRSRSMRNARAAEALKRERKNLWDTHVANEKAAHEKVAVVLAKLADVRPVMECVGGEQVLRVSVSVNADVVQHMMWGNERDAITEIARRIAHMVERELATCNLIRVARENGHRDRIRADERRYGLVSPMDCMTK